MLKKIARQFEVFFFCFDTESRLIFKQPTSWRPRMSRDIMISVSAEMSTKALEPNVNALQLPVQVLFS